MTTTNATASKVSAPRPEKALALALRLAHAEHALLALTSGQVDAIVDPRGKTYLLRPAQEHLRRSERRLQAVIESAADVITVVNRGGAILSQSHAVSRVLGYEPEELVGRSFFELIHEDDLPPLYSAFFHVIERFDENATAQFRHRARDGSYRLVEATVGKLRDVSPASVVFSLRPVISPLWGRTEPARPGALELSQAGKDHRQRTPLMEALLGIAALEEEIWNHSTNPPVATVGRKHELAARRPEVPLHFTNPSQPKVRLRLESIDAHEAAQSVLELCQGEAAAAQVELLLYLRAEENIVQADWARLLQAMCNLVRNAVESSTPGSCISIASTNDVPGRFTFELVGPGLGIEPALLPRVLDPLQPGDLSAPQLDAGLRSGLNIARRLAEAQGGTLAVSSEGRGKGATFRLTLNTVPLPNVAPVIVPLNVPSAPPPADPLFILLAEDRGDAMLADLLERCGHTVFAAPDLLTGLALAENCRFDLVISDTSLPDGNGYKLMERLRVTRPSLAGIALSGCGTPSDIDQSRQAGFSEHLVKPVTLDRLQSAIQAVATKTSSAARHGGSRRP
jgi:two-component system CheB/CheR fusion protein